MDPIISLDVDCGAFVRTAAKQSTLPAAVAFVITAAVFFAMPRAWKDRLGMDTGGLFGGKSIPAIAANRLVPLIGTIAAPAYANLRTESFKEPSTVTGLVGSRVMITGEGAPEGILVTLQEFPPVADTVPDSVQKKHRVKQPEDQLATNDSAANAQAIRAADSARKDSLKTRKKLPVVPVFQQLKVVAGGRGWTTAFALSDSNPALLTLVDRQYHRTIVINPVIDQCTGRLICSCRPKTPPIKRSPDCAASLR